MRRDRTVVSSSFRRFAARTDTECLSSCETTDQPAFRGIGKDCPGFFMAVGNHIPANTPVENSIYCSEVYEELSRR